MNTKTIARNGKPLTLQTFQKADLLGITFWQGRAMFRIAGDTARVDVVTTERHGCPQSAEDAVIALAIENGWGAT